MYKCSSLGVVCLKITEQLSDLHVHVSPLAYVQYMQVVTFGTSIICLTLLISPLDTVEASHFFVSNELF